MTSVRLRGHRRAQENTARSASRRDVGCVSCGCGRIPGCERTPRRGEYSVRGPRLSMLETCFCHETMDAVLAISEYGTEDGSELLVTSFSRERCLVVEPEPRPRQEVTTPAMWGKRSCFFTVMSISPSLASLPGCRILRLGAGLQQQVITYGTNVHHQS